MDAGSLTFDRIVLDRDGDVIDQTVTSFYRPGEPSAEVCTAELLKALQKQREAELEVRTWERKLRQRREGR